MVIPPRGPRTVRAWELSREKTAGDSGASKDDGAKKKMEMESGGRYASHKERWERVLKLADFCTLDVSVFPF